MTKPEEHRKPRHWIPVTSQLPRGLRVHKSPLVTRDVEVGAQRPPDVPWLDAVLDRLGGGSSAECRERVVDEHRRAAHRPELTLDELLEFGQPHRTNLRRRRERFMAHPYRIYDRRDAGACPPGSLTVPRRRQHLADGGHQRF